MLFSYLSFPPSIIVALYSLLIFLLHYLYCYCWFIVFLYILIFYWLSTSQVSLPILSVVSYTKQKSLNLMSSITLFSSLQSMLYFSTSCKKYIPSLLQRHSLTLFYNNFIVLPFTFRALFQWESFLLLYGMSFSAVFPPNILPIFIILFIK